jgi:hypothetical protein
MFLTVISIIRWAVIFAIVVASALFMIKPELLVRRFNKKRDQERYNAYREAGGGHLIYIKYYKIDERYGRELLDGYEKSLLTKESQLEGFDGL